jgi:hypothetical protein
VALIDRISGPPAADPKRRAVKLAEAAVLIQTGDLLLFRRVPFCWSRPSTWPSKLIAAAGRSEYTHAAKVAWAFGELWCLEVREFKGGRIVTLASQVALYSGHIDVFEANWKQCFPEFDRVGVVKYMAQFAGCAYGWKAIAKAALLHLFFARTRVKPNMDDQSFSSDPPFCSQACAMADRFGGGVDVVPFLADQITEPADLARTTFYRYRCTLEAD